MGQHTHGKMRETVWVCLCVCVLSVCSALICPDGGMCDDENTCCQTSSGGYGCCPLPNAECCSDHLHCCYEGTLCDLAHGKCINKTHSLVWVKRVPAQKSVLLKAVVCPDQKSECPDGTTCCELPDGTWGCCPMPNAVCCEDKMHCCPAGTKCDLAHAACVSPTLGSTPLWRKLPAHRRAKGDKKADVSVKGTSEKVLDSNDVDCPDHFSTCPDGTTCCPLGNGSYGCCPMPQAVCCSDHEHCCPEATTCDLVHGTCTSVSEVKVTEISPVLHPKTSGQNIPCNDTVACEDGSTCCKKINGDWGCCPLPQAVCCEDHIHCCPHATVCDLEEGTCDSPTDPLTSSLWVEKVDAFQRVAQPTNQQCDETTSCPEGSTCCKQVSGDWGCCPLPQAVCCDDHMHCCPHDTVCNVPAQTCDSRSDSGARLTVPWVKKTPAVTLPLQTEHCDEMSFCPKGTTCCRQKSGDWACCPLPQAVCCNDHEHCCPQGYKCDVAEQSCEHQSLPSTPLFRKQAAMSMIGHADDNTNVIAETEAAMAPEHKCDAQTSCPGDNTCCFMGKLNKWGCCPLPQAVCCQDGDHCCPSGYTCDKTKATCIKLHLEVPWFTKQEARVSQGLEVTDGVSDVKCDPTTSCASGSTCCKLASGQWGCCPLVKAVCCEDREHCCPQGYTCDLSTGTCIHPFAVNTVALALEPSRSAEEVMCDATSGCSGTCCKISDTDWACCPFKQAVCCKDMKHCCPEGYLCDPKAKSCTKSPSLTWWDNSL